MVDVFEEVEEEMRADRWRRLARRYLPWAALGLALGLLVAGGVWGWREWSRTGAEQASVAYADALEALNAGDSRRAETKFREAVEGRSAAYTALGHMQIGGLRMTANNPRGAAESFDAAAAAAPDVALEDAARLKAVFARMDLQPYPASVEQLEPLVAEGRPYRLLALETLALARIGAGQAQAARSDLNVLSIAPDAPQPVQNRARALIALIDSGAAPSLPAVARAAASLPPPPPPAVLPPQSTAPAPAPAPGVQ